MNLPHRIGRACAPVLATVALLAGSACLALAAGRAGGGELTSLCSLGITAPDAAGTWDQMYFDGTDNWLTAIRLDPASCAQCTSSTQGVLEAVHIKLFLPVAPCTLTVRVRVVKNFGQESCPFPDGLADNDPTGCPPFFATLIAGADDSLTVKEFVIPFPATTPWGAPSCAIQPDSSKFVELNFTSVNAAARDTLKKPEIVVGNVRNPCTSFNRFEGNQLGSDVTSVSDIGINNPKIWVDVRWCESVPTRRQSWGRLKQIYR